MKVYGQLEYAQLEQVSGIGALLGPATSGRMVQDISGTYANPLFFDNTNWRSIALVSNAPASKTGSYSLGINDEVVVFTAVATATLPTAVGVAGKRYTIINKSTSAVNVTVATTSSQTVGGRASGDIVLSLYDTYVSVISDGANWQITGKNEYTYLNNPGTSEAVPSTSGYYIACGASVVLTVGTWNVKALFTLNGNSSTVAAAIAYSSGFYGADGTGSGTAPTAVSGQVSGPAFISSVTSLLNTPYFSGNVPGGVISPTLEGNFVVTSGTITVYAVPNVNFSTRGSMSVSAFITAQRIF